MNYDVYSISFIMQAQIPNPNGGFAYFPGHKYFTRLWWQAGQLRALLSNSKTNPLTTHLLGSYAPYGSQHLVFIMYPNMYSKTRPHDVLCSGFAFAPQSQIEPQLCELSSETYSPGHVKISRTLGSCTRQPLPSVDRSLGIVFARMAHSPRAHRHQCVPDFQRNRGERTASNGEFTSVFNCTHAQSGLFAIAHPCCHT